MTDDEFLWSQHLLSYSEDGPRVELSGRPSSDEEQEILQTAVRMLREGRESMQEADLSELESMLARVDPRFLKREFDREYSIQLLQEVPRIVERVLKLSTLIAKSRTPSRRTEVYLRESTRCYVLGLWSASIVLSRAAVEHSLRERVAQREDRSSDKLSALIEGARRFGILDDAHSQLATRVKLRGDHVLHGGAGTDEDARTALEAARDVLEHLHR